jgi:hypothetical protein
MRYQHRRHQQWYGPHTRVNPGRQYGPHPRQATCSIGVKFCAAELMLPAPREVCASAVRAADPASSRAIARVRVTFRIVSLSRDCQLSPPNSSPNTHAIKYTHAVKYMSRRGGKPGPLTHARRCARRGHPDRHCRQGSHALLKFHGRNPPAFYCYRVHHAWPRVARGWTHGPQRFFLPRCFRLSPNLHHPPLHLHPCTSNPAYLHGYIQRYSPWLSGSRSDTACANGFPGSVAAHWAGSAANRVAVLICPHWKAWIVAARGGVGCLSSQ